MEPTTTKVSDNIKSKTLELLQEYRQSQDVKIRNQIVSLNIGLVRKEAHHWSRQCSENFDDLMQVGAWVYSGPLSDLP